ncbi:ABC transporter ATP-binding protein [Halopenitus persicus]|uniref:ABC-2 type transport system ATP-binding protein n=1 Tax=Halopenitus persicus TaxID=1048396 RepID=A0A1H3MW49_9EURY|nr:ABC transporter ATP-binding protein [Halopenitus persicus]SDY80708.1 ABC-2 type transport system ATP-binding protein [Halopenitus persicus]
MSDPAILIEGLTKQYGSTTAVDDLTLTVASDEIYGFLGPNGAGKSTTIGMLMDYIRPTTGSISVLGQDPQRDVIDVHSRVGILPDRYSLYDRLSARQHLELVIDTKRVSESPAALLDRVGLNDVDGQSVGTFSQGMEQRLALAMALVGDPDLLVLDEPFTGLDPHGVRTVREIVHEENDRGAAVFFSSHVLGQVELVCDRIGILHEGRRVVEGTIDSLRAETPVGSDATVEEIFVAVTGGSGQSDEPSSETTQ